MGISIHYKGKLTSKNVLPQLIEEVKDVAIAQNWKHHVFEEKFPEEGYGEETFNSDLHGISFSPEECEPVCLTFLSNGTMASVISWHIRFNLKDEMEMAEFVSVKTQYAGPAIHKTVVLFLEHLSKKYFKEFELSDEAEYWETKDEKLLKKNFEFLTGMINSFETGLEMIPMKENETFEEYVLRIADGVNRKKKD